MSIKQSLCEWDSRFVRCERIAGDGVVDRVTYEPADGSAETTSVLIREALAQRRRWSVWTLLGVGFAVGVAVGHATIAMTQTL